MAARSEYKRPEGIVLMTSCVITRWTVVLFTSTTGDSPVTTTVSSIAPTFISALTVRLALPTSWRPSCLAVLNPGSVNVTE